MGTHHTELGTFCKSPYRTRDGIVLTMAKMSGYQDPRETLWRNIVRLMEHHYGAMNQNRLAALTKIGLGSVTRLKNLTSSIGTVESVAKHFKLEVWHMFLPDLDPADPPVGPMTATQKKMLEKHLAVRRVIADDPPKDEPAAFSRSSKKVATT